MDEPRSPQSQQVKRTVSVFECGRTGRRPKSVAMVLGSKTQVSIPRHWPAIEHAVCPQTLQTSVDVIKNSRKFDNVLF